MAPGRTSGWLIVAERPEAYAPQPGDLICFGRGNAHELRYDDLPAGHFPGHCDIVVDTAVPGQIGVVGGNVDDAVTLKHVPVTPDGKLATPEGRCWTRVTRGWWCCGCCCFLRIRRSRRVMRGVGTDRQGSGDIQRIHLGVGEHARAGDEPHAVRSFQREAVAAFVHHVDGELTVRPVGNCAALT